jgi:hypothetical protein
MKLALPETSRPQNKVPGKAVTDIFESMFNRIGIRISQLFR